MVNFLFHSSSNSPSAQRIRGLIVCELIVAHVFLLFRPDPADLHHALSRIMRTHSGRYFDQHIHTHEACAVLQCDFFFIRKVYLYLGAMNKLHFIDTLLCRLNSRDISLKMLNLGLGIGNHKLENRIWQVVNISKKLFNQMLFSR